MWRGVGVGVHVVYKTSAEFPMLLLCKVLSWRTELDVYCEGVTCSPTAVALLHVADKRSLLLVCVQKVGFCSRFSPSIFDLSSG